MTQPQILSIAAIALVIAAFLLTLVIAYVRARRASSGRAGSAPLMTRLAAASSASAGAEIGPTGPIGSALPKDHTYANGNGGHADGPRPAPGPAVAGIEDPVLWTRLTDAEVARIARYRVAATIVVIEVDGLDRLIDTLGPVAGERILAATAGTIRAEARATDTVSRLGPHRFGVLLPETEEVAAINYIERVRATCDRWLAAGAVAVRLAIGWAGLTSELGLAGTIRLCENRLDQERRQVIRREARALGEDLPPVHG